MMAVERHETSLTLDRVCICKGPEIIALDDEGRVGSIIFEFSGRIHGMNDCGAEAAAGLHDARDFADRLGHRVHVVKRHEGNHEIGAVVGHRKRRCIRTQNGHRRVGGLRGSHQRRRGIDPDDLMAEAGLVLPVLPAGSGFRGMEPS